MFSKKGYNADAKLLISLGLRHYPSKFHTKKYGTTLAEQRRKAYV